MPAIFVTLMRLLMPGWSNMAVIAHTIPYNLAVMAGTQTGKPLPAGRWTCAQATILVAVGSKSEAIFRAGAKALAWRALRLRKSTLLSPSGSKTAP